MTLQAALAAARLRLQQADIEDSELEAEVLLRYATGLDRTGLFLRALEDLDPEAEVHFDTYVERRLQHEPSAYITGHREFYSLDLEVTPATLIPRPETETLVGAALHIARGRSEPVIADVGTGSGAIAIALATALPEARLYATDVSDAALEVAIRNATTHEAAERISFLSGDMLEPILEPVDIVVANLPYVTTDDWQALPPELREHEPRTALDGGPDGLDAYRALLLGAASHLNPGAALLFEFGPEQQEPLTELALSAFPTARVRCLDDLAGLPRVLVIEN